jgi:hypothetical protein
MLMVKQQHLRQLVAFAPSLCLSRVVVFHSSVGLRAALVVGVGAGVRLVWMVWGRINRTVCVCSTRSCPTQCAGQGQGRQQGQGLLLQAKAGRRIIPVDHTRKVIDH